MAISRCKMVSYLLTFKKILKDEYGWTQSKFDEMWSYHQSELNKQKLDGQSTREIAEYVDKFLNHQRKLIMGFFDFLKKSVSDYTDPYDYKTDAVLKCVNKLLEGDIGDLRKVQAGNDWVFAGGTVRALMGAKILDENYFYEIDNYFHRGVSLEECVSEICKKIGKTNFIRMCDEYANRPFRGL